VPPLVSCIVPAHNYGRFVGEALDSILAQTYRPIEVVVVDAGSTDDTSAVLARYGDAVRCVTRGEILPAEARNVGICETRGEFVALLDADDLWHPKKLAYQMARFEARPELGYCLSLVQPFWTENMREYAERFRGSRRLGPIPGYATVTLLARREVFQTVGLLNPALTVSDAVEWFLRASDLGVPMEMLPEVLVYRRLHGKNFTWRGVAAQRKEWLRLIKTRLDARRRGLAADLPGFSLPDFGPDV
jgi:glycosyltransferase involved in cell wall biosynthesis